MNEPDTGTEPTRILLVEDDRSDARLISAYLNAAAAAPIAITHCVTLADAGSHSGDHFDCILTDLNLPDSTGADTVQRITAVFPGQPVIAMTIDEVRGVECIKAGAQDFIRKSELNADSLNRSIEFAVQRAEMAREVTYASRHDPLTGLLNRSAFADVAAGMLDAAKPDQRMFLLFVDLDGFKSVNDDHGHQAGDQVLQVAAQRIRSVTRSSDVVCRWGGDEFAALGRLVDGDPRTVADRVAMAIGHPVGLTGSDGSHVPLSASVGVVVSDADRRDLTELVALADHDMYAVKRTVN